VEFSFSDEPKKGGAPATKLYSTKKKTARRDGVQESGAERRGAKNTAPAEETAGHRHQATPASRIGIMFSGFLFAGMVLFTLSGYERTSRAYADVNAINSEIDDTELRIKALDVQIECAVTIQDAQETAERYGMQYPTQSQYVRIGGSIPVSGNAVSGSAPTGSDLGIGETVPGTDTGETDTPTDTPSGD